MTIDEYHHWYDVLAGGIIGTLMATSAYRMVYASVWDFRFSELPAPKDFVVWDFRAGFPAGTTCSRKTRLVSYASTRQQC